MELTAAISMLDERHPRLPPPDPNDDNSYTYGAVGGHNVVIASLPDGEMGTNSAAHAATQMKRSFPWLSFGLMVGIGGGVPSPKNDVRLGDIVVSRPIGQYGGVFQYDHGKNTPGGFVMTGFLNAPPVILRTAITTLRGECGFPGGSKLNDHLLNNPNLPQEFRYPGAMYDDLFKPEYEHVGEDETCTNCDRSGIVGDRPPRNSGPIVHYGTIASGNQVMGNAVIRDQLAAQHGVLCFEMEAAGLMNNFPCVVIRGVTDYADSHKKKRWQHYAAATAAAYAKELLRFIHPDQVTHTVAAATSSISSMHTPTPHNVGETRQSPSSRSFDHTFFFNAFLGLKSVAIGRLIIDAKHPGQDYWPVAAVALHPDDVDEVEFKSIRDFIGEENYDGFLGNLNKMFRGKPTTSIEIASSASKVYSLVQPIMHFRQLCKDIDARKWIEIMRKIRPIFLIIGIVTVRDATVTQGRHQSSGLEDVAAPTNVDLRFMAPGERVIGIQYRRVKFRILSSSKIDTASLMQNQWKMLLGGDRGGSDDVLEVSVEEPIRQEDLALDHETNATDVEEMGFMF
jgi:nucleoside phosphorylase